MLVQAGNYGHGSSDCLPCNRLTHDLSEVLKEEREAVFFEDGDVAVTSSLNATFNVFELGVGEKCHPDMVLSYDFGEGLNVVFIGEVIIDGGKIDSFGPNKGDGEERGLSADDSALAAFIFLARLFDIPLNKL